MPNVESTPLLGVRPSRTARPPSWPASFKFFFFESWFNILLVFIPLSFISHFLNWDAVLRFSFSFFAIVPLAKLIGDATDQLSMELGQTLSGLLNASFGNAVEIIVGIAALLQGELRIVQTSMLGSILSNLLLVLGCAFFAGGVKYPESVFQTTAAQTSSSLMTLACITLVIPAAYHTSKADPKIDDSSLSDLFTLLQLTDDTKILPRDASQKGLLSISRGTAIILLIVYVGYLYFQLKTHKHLFISKREGQNTWDDLQQILQEQSQSNGNSHGSQEELYTAPRITTTVGEEHERARMNIAAAGVGLLIVTVVTSFCADYLVASIEETAQRYNIPKAFIGIVILPIVANAAEHVTAVWMALKGRAELPIGICVGSSIQIAMFVIPSLVIIGWISGHDLTLFFSDFETIVLFVSVFLVNILLMDGKSNYMEGLMLVALYLVIALACNLGIVKGLYTYGKPPTPLARIFDILITM